MSSSFLNFASLFALACFASMTQITFGQGDSLRDDLVSYWPLDEIQGNSTPDLASGFDFFVENLTSTDIITGRFGMAFNFKKANKAHLVRNHDPADDLPAIKNDSFTVAYWVRAVGTGQRDLRTFSEASNITNDGTPLFTMATSGDGSDGSIGILFRDRGDFTTFYDTTEATPLDGMDWRHIAFVQTAQDDGSATRQIFIDGVLDSLVIDPKPANFTHNMNTTSIGAVVRASDSAHIDGDIDEVAIWKRALTQAEIDDLRTNGMPDLDVLQEDLAISSFTPEFQRVVEGDQVRLSWDATQDATLTIDQGVGDVTAISDFGVGSTMVTISAETTFTLTASRGAEPPVTQSITVSPITGVAAEWNWIEDFSDLNLGALGSQNSWRTPSGSWDVTTIGNTQSLITSGGNDLTGRIVETHAIQENSSRTLFFRFCVNSVDSDLPIRARVGMTEKSLRFVNDWNDNNGTYVIFTRDAGGDLQLQAIDGINGTPVDSGMTFTPGTSYDVWIDVQNVPLDMTDTFSVHVAPTGGARQTVFANFSSDREPQEVVLLGVPRPVIDTVFLVTTTATNLGPQAIAFDDFYISDADVLSSTVPVASGFGKVPQLPSRIEISNIAHDSDADTTEITWASSEGQLYEIRKSLDLTGNPSSWQLVMSDVAGAASPATTTTAIVDTAATEERAFYVVIEIDPPALFEEDFESGSGGWVNMPFSGDSGNTVWEWGAPSNVGPPTGADGSMNSFGTNISANYGTSSFIGLVSPPIDLTGVTSANLSFEHYLQYESDFDFARVIAVENGTSNELGGSIFEGSTSAAVWSRVIADLPDEAFGQVIQLQFTFESTDVEANLAGWYIDNVSVNAE